MIRALSSQFRVLSTSSMPEVVFEHRYIRYNFGCSISETVQMLQVNYNGNNWQVQDQGLS